MIRVNDTEMEWKKGMTVKNLLKSLEYTDYHFPVLVLTVNGKHIPCDMFEKTPIEDGDEIKFFLPLGGG